MQEPSLRTSRLALTSGIVAAIVIGVGGFLIGRGTTERPPASPAHPEIATPISPAPPAVIAPAVWSRADLIALASVAADVMGGGSDGNDRLNSAVGRRFEIRLPFGCNGQAEKGDNANLRWEYDTGTSTLRVNAEPINWRSTDWWDQNPPKDIAAIEGFWIHRPWTTSEACPATAISPNEAEPQLAVEERQTLALGQVFLPDSPRRSRRGSQPYQITKRVVADELELSKGFQLRLSGRVAGLPDNKGPVRCQQAAGPDQRPICLVGIILDQVAIEAAANGETVATWDVATSDKAKAGSGS